MTNTIKKVTIVVLVLMISCQLSEKPNMGPFNAQRTSTATAERNAHGLPVQPATRRENRSNTLHIESMSAAYPNVARTNPDEECRSRLDTALTLYRWVQRVTTLIDA